MPGLPDRLAMHAQATPRTSILTVSGSEESIQGDAELVSALLLLEACLLKRKRLLRAPLHVLGTIRRPDTVQVANHILARLCE